MSRLWVIFLIAFSIQLAAQKVNVPVWVVKDSSHYNTKFLDSTQYLNGQKHGRSVLYKREILFREQNWESGKLNGRSVEYSDGQVIEIINYRNGIPVDTSFEYSTQPVYHMHSKVIYYPDGRRKMRIQYNKTHVMHTHTYYNPVSGIDSTFRYYASGIIKQESRDVDKVIDPSGQTGGWKAIKNYYPSGVLESTGLENSAHKEREWIFYDTAGILLARINYFRGEPHGWYTSYYPDSTVQLKTYCYKAYTDTITAYDDEGNEILPWDSLFNPTIDAQQKLHREVHFRNPNDFSPRNLYNRDDSIHVFIMPEGASAMKQASFPGGMDSLNAFFRRNIVYPAPEKSALLEGNVYIEFTIQADGSVTDIFGHGGPEGNWGLEKEALRVFRLTPNWIPANYNGKNMKTTLEIVVCFYIL